MKVLVFGSLNLDYVYKVNHFVQPGETLSSDEMNIFCGGKGLNQSVAFANSGMETWHAGAIGNSGTECLLEMLQKAGVHTDLIQKKEIPNGHAIIQTTPDGENNIILYGGANRKITKEDVKMVISKFESGDYIVLQNEINQLSYIMEKAHEKGMKIVLNPSPMNEKIFKLSLSYVDYFLLNEVEGSAVCELDETNPKKLADKLTEKFPDAKIVLTLGKAGSVYAFGKERIYQEIFPVETVDTTAAGDTFTGFFMSEIIRGKEPKEALKTASLASSIAVGRAGAAPSIPTYKEVQEKLNLR